MKGKFLKRAAICVTALLVAGSAAMISGCEISNGRDGINGQNLNIYDIWEAAKEQTGDPDLAFDDFLKEYLSYEGGEISEAVSLKAAINRSLMSAVSIMTTFYEYTAFTAGEQSYYGSGVIVDIDKEAGDMTIVTNCHVVYSANAVTTSSGSGLGEENGFARTIKVWLYGADYPNSGYDEAQIIGASKNYDIAVLKVTDSDIVKKSSAVKASWNAAEEPIVGDTVYTVGNANGDDIAASVGFVSRDSEEITVNLGTDRRPDYHNYRVLRTDTAINGGNSGGGLFNRSGELIGIVNAKTISEDIDNMGYALCASTVRRVVDKMIATDDGNSGIELLSDLGFTYDVTDKYSTGLDEKGAAGIKEVVTVTNAPISAGLNTGDVLKRVVIKRNGETVDAVDVERLHNLTDVIITVRPGDEVVFTAMRGVTQVESSRTFTAGSFRRSV